MTFTKIEELILRLLRLEPNKAFHVSIIRDAIRKQQIFDDPGHITVSSVTKACKSLMDKCFLYEANFFFYGVTAEGKEYAENEWPLFQAHHRAPKGANNDVKCPQ